MKHTRNIAGVYVTKIARSCYVEDCGDGRERWFIRYRVEGTKRQYIWQASKAFTPNGKRTPDVYARDHRTLTEAVIWSRGRK